MTDKQRGQMNVGTQRERDPQKVLKARHKREKLEKTFYFILSFVLVILVWEVGRATHLINPRLFPSFPSVIKAFIDLMSDGSLIRHISASFLRVIIGFSIGIAAAVVLGFLIGWFRIIRLIVDPLVSFFRALPPIALIPLMIIFFGIGETSKIIVLTYASFFPALVVIYQALVGLDPIYGRAAQTLGVNNREMFRLIILPQLYPHIITACRVSLGVCWATLVAAELIAAQQGIGAMMVDAQNFFQMAPLVLGVLLIGAISLIMDSIVRAIERRATAWQEKRV